MRAATLMAWRSSYFTYFGSNLELEHRHTLWGMPGAVKLLGYRNQVFTGSFDDAVNAY